MADLRPFRAVRFAGVPPTEALCPPYDVIPPAQEQVLRGKERNAIHIELPRGGDGRYEGAARLWRKWLASGVLATDLGPAFYALEQRFKYGGRAGRRLGLFADLSLKKKGKDVLPHEHTFAKPRKDRELLLNALGANTSPVFLLAPDGDRRFRGELERAAKGKPVLEGPDPSGKRLRLFRIEPGRIERLFRSRPLLIADGHHRFRVAVEHAAAAKADTGVLVYVAPDQNPGLLLATHRVTREALPILARLKAVARLTPARAGATPSFLIVSTRRGRWQVRPKRPYKGLPVEWLAEVLALRAEETAAYTHDAREAERLARSSGGAALILPAPTVQGVRKALKRSGLLPQKSTYFYPKVPTGLLFRTLP